MKTQKARKILTPIKTNQDSFWNAIKPFYLIVKTLGFAPFHIVGDQKNGIIKTSITDTFTFVIALAIQIYLIMVNVTVDLSLSSTKTILIDKMAHLVQILNVLNVFFSTILTAIFRDKIWGIFRKCSAFDKEMKQLGILFDYKRAMRNLRGIFVLGAIVFCLMFLGTWLKLDDIIASQHKFYFALSYFIVNGYVTLILMSFCLYLLAIYRRFELINHCIK